MTVDVKKVYDEIKESTIKLIEMAIDAPIAIHIPNKEDFKLFIELADGCDIEMETLGESIWNIYEEHTCISIETLNDCNSENLVVMMYSPLDYYEVEEQFNIVTFSKATQYRIEEQLNVLAEESDALEEALKKSIDNLLVYVGKSLTSNISVEEKLVNVGALVATLNDLSIELDRE